MAKQWTYKDLIEITGKNISQLRNIVYKLNISSKIIGGCSYFSADQMENIKNYTSPRRVNKYKKAKISIIEEYLRTGSARKTASLLHIQKELVNITVKEWKENNNEITVESKMNFSDKEIKNILKRGEKYSYLWTYKGNRYWKGGFKTENEAFEALCKLKEKIGREK